MNANVARNKTIHTPQSLIVIDGAGIPMEIPHATITGLSKKPMKVSSLRPGDVIGLNQFRYTILINSAKEQRIVLHDGTLESSWPYRYFSDSYVFVKHQPKRAWLAALPKWVSKRISPYPLP